MRLHLFRHGPAGRRDDARRGDDALRPLTERGAERTALAAAGFARLERERVAVWTSPLERARETARILIEMLGREVEFAVCPALEPTRPPDEVIRALAAVRTVDAIVLVGHEPHLGRLASTLLFGTPGHPLTLKKAGVCTLAFDDRIAPGEARLCGFLAPRVLRRLGGRASRIAVVAGHVAAHERAS